MSPTDPLDDAPQERDPEYRSLSGMAVLGLVLGLASPAFYFGQPLVIIPLAALAASLVAVAKIKANPEVLTGLALAQCGTLLAVASIAAVTTNKIVVTRLLSNQAAVVADEWVRCAREGLVEDAYRLTLTPKNRRSPNATLAPEAAQSWEESVAKYGETDPMPAFAQLKPSEARLVDFGLAGWRRGGRVELWRQYDLFGDAGQVIAKVSVLLSRSAPSGDEPGRWLVNDTGIAPPGR